MWGGCDAWVHRCAGTWVRGAWIAQERRSRMNRRDVRLECFVMLCVPFCEVQREVRICGRNMEKWKGGRVVRVQGKLR